MARNDPQYRWVTQKSQVDPAQHKRLFCGMRSRAKRRLLRAELRKWNSDVYSMDVEWPRFSTTSSFYKSNFVSKLAKRLTCRRNLVTYSSCKCKRMLCKKVTIAMLMAHFRRYTVAVQLPFTPSPSRFSSHTWVEVANNRLFKLSWEGVMLENCFLMIQSLRKTARPSVYLDIAAWVMTEVLPLGSHMQLSSDYVEV